MSAVLDVHIDPTSDHTYGVTVFKRGSSQPLAKSSFEFDLSAVAHYEIGRLEIDAKHPHGRMERIKAYGQQLHKKLFSPQITQLWDEFKKGSDFLVLCLRLDPKASDLEALPWETLYDGDEFLAAGAKTGLSRLPLDIEIQKDLPVLDLPVRMLGLLSSPLDLEDHERLRIEREQEVLLQAVKGVSDLINFQGMVNVDFADVRTIMGSKGVALMGVGTATGEHKTVEAAQRAVNSPLLDDVSIVGATSVLINITGNSNLTMYEIHEASTLIQEEAHEDAEVIWGWVIDDTMEDEARVTVIATGFEDRRQMLQPQAVERAVNERIVRHMGGGRSPRGRELHSGIDRLYEDYDIPTFFKTAD